MIGSKQTCKRWASSVLLLIILFLIGAVVGSCGLDDSQQKDSDTIVRIFTASFSSMTKTYISADASVSWDKYDQVKYYSADGGKILNYTVEEAGSEAQMSFTVGKDASYVVAVYGGLSISHHTKDALRLYGAVNSTQDGTFPGGHIAIARSESLDSPSLSFYNVVSFISFSTKRQDVSYVILTSIDQTPIHGNGSVALSFDNGVPVADFGSDSGASIRVNLSGEGTYYITTLPVKLNDGFSISCYDSSGKLIGRAIGKNPLIVNRSRIIRLGNIDGRLVDENGVRIDGYDDEIPWDPSEDTGGDIDYGGYGDDEVWDSGADSDGNVSHREYDEDYDWDSDSNNSDNVSKLGFGEDNNWNN